MFNGKKIFLIVACDLRNVIGSHGKIPWQGKVPSDMRRFRSLTIGDSVAMGRKTWDSLPSRFKPLPERQNIIITANPQFSPEGKDALIAYSPEEAVRIAHSSIVWVIGGEQIFKLFLPVADEIHTTIIHKRFEGDAFFPQIDSRAWDIVEKKFLEANNKGDDYDSDYFRLVRCS